jgi:hypothetical protein
VSQFVFDAGLVPGENVKKPGNGLVADEVSKESSFDMLTSEDIGEY